MDIVLFGIQGSGKGTQAKRLAAEFGFDIFEAGGELRKIAATDSELGHTVKSFIDAGKLVPHMIIMAVVKEAVASRPKEQRILFDGIPRDEHQMRDFEHVMNELGRPYKCIHITLPREKAIERILGRAKIENRKDDADIATIERRMDTFTEKTLPVIETYARQGNMLEVDGDAEPEEVYERLKAVVEGM